MGEGVWLGNQGVEWVSGAMVEWFWVGKGGVGLALRSVADCAGVVGGFVGLKFDQWFG